ncbi:MAG: flagellar hook assembly protein FlgD [Candidatus Eisenbacteria bacterium]|uniref:Basal-body rod modification protein FlgD n=1 Tax=Eiseniibacteriota bacterium TaxID=2212470 RepID=A0A956N8D3_UNCEI|nr:flagellar hook assembly protein FlgD [Candidatus Eisenbacteria bacterium]
MEITSLAGAGLNTTTLRQTDDTLGKDTFLQLLITQMRYQDPLSPMENEAFLAQLAQFSSLEQMQQLNESFQSVIDFSQSQANSGATSLIGKHVRAAGEHVEVGAEGNVELGYFLSQPAQAVEIRVVDESGATIKTLVQNDVDSGSNTIEWDGRDAGGSRVPAGTYSFEVTATDTTGQEVPVTRTVTGLVEGVTFRSGQALLLVNGREVPLSDVLDVYLPEE